VNAETAVLAGGAFMAAVVSGIGGFGFALCATAIWLLVLDPHLVAVLAVAFTLVLNLANLPIFWRDVDLRRLAPLAAGCLLGVPLGVWALGALAPGTLRAVIGGVLLLYGAWALLRPARPALQLSGRASDAAGAGIGVASGVLGGLGGLCGFMPALWAAARAWPKRESRGFTQAYVLFTNLLTLLFMQGLLGLGQRAWEAFLLALPFVLAGLWVGLKVFARFDTATFHRAVLWVVTASGALLLLGSNTTR
jgi:uncharacterized protein